MQFIRTHWKVALAIVWSVVAVVELLKGNWVFGAFSTFVAVVTVWDYYIRDKPTRQRQEAVRQDRT
jgi:membrane protein YdbS with pleckstrin-like domain